MTETIDLHNQLHMATLSEHSWTSFWRCGAPLWIMQRYPLWTGLLQNEFSQFCLWAFAISSACLMLIHCFLIFHIFMNVNKLSLNQQDFIKWTLLGCILKLFAPLCIWLSSVVNITLLQGSIVNIKELHCEHYRNLLWTLYVSIVNTTGFLCEHCRCLLWTQ